MNLDLVMLKEQHDNMVLAKYLAYDSPKLDSILRLEDLTRNPLRLLDK